MNDLRTLVKNSFKESFYEEKKKKQLMFLSAFFISYKNDVKFFLKWIFKSAWPNIYIYIYISCIEQSKAINMNCAADRKDMREDLPCSIID